MDLAAYGTENVGIVVDKFKKTFPVPRETVKQKAIDLIEGGVLPQDAYMYEGKEGVKVIMPEGRIEVLPGSVHFWCMVDKIRSYGDWLVDSIYLPDKKI